MIKGLLKKQVAAKGRELSFAVGVDDRVGIAIRDKDTISFTTQRLSDLSGNTEWEKAPESYRHFGCLFPGMYSLVTIEKPAIPEAEILESLRWEISDLVGFDVEKASIDYFELPKGARQDNAMICVYALSENNSDMINDLPVSPASNAYPLTTPEFALAGLLSRLESEPMLCVLVASQGSLVMAYEGGELLMVRQSSVVFEKGAEDIGASRLVKDCQNVMNHLRGHFPDRQIQNLVLFSDDESTVAREKFSFLSEDSLGVSIREYPWSTLKEQPGNFLETLALGVLLNKQAGR